MREIKFRAWDGEKMSSSFTLRQALYRTDTWDDFGENWDGTFMQYTGLKDRNGVEIYEGDVIRFPDLSAFHCGLVEFDAGEYHLICKDGNKFMFGENADHSLGYTAVVEREVIGNIHNNPELLTNNPTNDN